jgi:mannose-6-phosphate isomerase-like protein (cupin superfamily)
MLTIRKAILMGIVTVAAGAGWLATSVAQEKKTSPGVLYFNRSNLDASFKKAEAGTGSAILWGRTTSAGTYEVHTNSRFQSGQAEVHSHKVFTAVVYVISGEANLIIGGDGVTSKPGAPDKFGGQSIHVGESHHIAQGDMIVVPPGTPHSYKDVKEPFHYLEVQVP